MPAILTALPPAKIAVPAQPKTDPARVRAAEQDEHALRTVNAAQNAKAVAVKLERLARRDPAIASLVEERAAYLAAADKLGEKLTALEARHSELAAHASRLEEANIAIAQELTVVRRDLAAALKSKR